MKEIFSFIKDFIIALTPIILGWFIWQQSKIKKTVTEVKDKVVEVKDTVAEVKDKVEVVQKRVNGGIANEVVEAIKLDPDIEVKKKP